MCAGRTLGPRTVPPQPSCPHSEILRWEAFMATVPKATSLLWSQPDLESPPTPAALMKSPGEGLTASLSPIFVP